MRFFFTCGFPRATREPYTSADAKEIPKDPIFRERNMNLFKSATIGCNAFVLTRACVPACALPALAAKPCCRDAERSTRDAYAPPVSLMRMDRRKP
jgi:hypothetical protein